MGRLHLFEFNDLKGLPLAVRKTQTEFLTVFSLKFKVYNKSFDKLLKHFKNSTVRHVQALCAGDGGIIKAVSQREDYQDISFTLSDLHPNIDRFTAIENASEGRINFITEPVNILTDTSRLKGLRLIINAVHHFKPGRAEKILSDAVKDKQAVVFLEPIQRNPIALLKVLVISPMFCVLMSLGFFMPFNFRRLLTGLLIPVATFTFIFDGIVSHLRAYTANELRAMVRNLKNHEDFDWEITYIKGIAGSKVTYLSGFPKKHVRAH